MHFAPTLQYAVPILYLVCNAHSVVCSLLFAVTSTNTVVFVVGIVRCCHARLFRDERAVVKLPHHGRRAGEEEKIEIRVVSGETTLIHHIETYQV